jgi:hypothetical protein
MTGRKNVAVDHRPDRKTADTLIMAGIADDRADAIRLVLPRFREQPEYEELRERGREIDRIRAEFQLRQDPDGKQQVVTAQSGAAKGRPGPGMARSVSGGAPPPSRGTRRKKAAAQDSAERCRVTRVGVWAVVGGLRG